MVFNTMEYYKAVKKGILNRYEVISRYIVSQTKDKKPTYYKERKENYICEWVHLFTYTGVYHKTN